MEERYVNKENKDKNDNVTKGRKQNGKTYKDKIKD